MKNCCGKNRDTKFCPDCGTRLNELQFLEDLIPSLKKLMDHCLMEESLYQKSSVWYTVESLGHGYYKERATWFKTWADDLLVTIHLLKSRELLVRRESSPDFPEKEKLTQIFKLISEIYQDKKTSSSDLKEMLEGIVEYVEPMIDSLGETSV